jgi:hypothetical protein
VKPAVLELRRKKGARLVAEAGIAERALTR